MAYSSSHIDSRQKMFIYGSCKQPLFLFFLSLLIAVCLFPESVSGITSSFKCPDGCFCDYFNDLIDCSGRGVSALTVHLSSTTRILLYQDNQFTWISQDTFNITKLRRLRKLSLADNLVTGVSQGSFAGLSKIVQLDMSGNLLFRIPHDIRLLKSLNELNLSHNAIQSIGPSNFHNDSKLEVLSLANNRLKFLDSDAFSALEHLQVLSLRNNSISNIMTGTLRRTTLLEELDLSLNKLGLNDPNSGGIIPLNVSDWFETPDACFFLKELTLSDNLLQDISGDSFDLLSSLETLDIHSNLLSNLNSFVFQKMSSLEALVASQNQLEALPLQLFKWSSSLRDIDFSENMISDIPMGTFSTNSRLETINVASNLLVNADWLLHSPESIREIYLSNNLIDILRDSAFKFLPNLQVVEMDNNQLTVFPRLWNNSRLTRLELTGNQISRIPSETRFHFYHELTYISLVTNTLDTLDADVFMSLPPVEQFLVDDNPFSCDCRLLWLDDLIVDYYDGLEIPLNVEPWFQNTYDSIVCYHPKGYRGAPLADIAINRHNLGCSYYADMRSIIGLVIGWLIMLSLVVFVYWRWKCKSAERHMRAWKPKKPRTAKHSRHKAPNVLKPKADRHRESMVNGKIKIYDSSSMEYISRFDHDSYNSVPNISERENSSPACACLLQSENHTQSSDILTETTV